MNSKQVKIYIGLKNIGEEIASFYADGIKMINSDYKIKSYLIAHIAREIEGGLRDIFAFTTQEEIEVCSTCGQPLKKHISHKQSIINLLGSTKENKLSKEWYNIAKEFHKYAHRHGSWKEPRNKDDFNELWLRFENILSKIIGNYYAIEDRLEHILRIDSPTKEILGTLPNILKHQARFVYFFNKLQSSKWLKDLFEQGYFLGKNNPEPIKDKNNEGYYSVPFWPVLEYLKKVSKSNYKNPKKEITKILIKIIDDIIGFKKDNKRIENYHTDYAVLKIISFLPTEEIKDNYFEFIKIALKGQFKNDLIESEIGKIFLKRFIEEKNKKLLIKTLDVILSFVVTEDNKIFPIMSEFWFRETIRLYKTDLLDFCSYEIYNISIKKIRELIRNRRFSFNTLTLPSIENHPQTMFPNKYECQIVYLVRDSLLKIPEKEIKNIVSNLLKENNVLLKLALYTINQRYNLLLNLFWNWIKNPLKYDIGYKHELFELFKNHAKDFTKVQLNVIIKWIENKKYQLSDDEKKEWFLSLLTSENKIIQKKYDKYNKLYPSKIKYPGFNSGHSGLIGVTSPLSKEDILSKSLSENIEFFISFSNEQQDFLGPSIEGLADIIIDAIKEKPKNFIGNCNDIIKAPIYFQFTWICGLKKSWEANKLFDINKVLNISYKILHNAEFWKNNNSNKNEYENLYIMELLRFIEDGIKNDENAFDVKNLKLIKKIILYVFKYDKTEINNFNYLSEMVFNNSKGVMYSALFQYSLKYAKENKEKSNKWDIEIKQELEKKIISKETDVLFFFTLGRFFRNLLFIDSEWTNLNLNNIFSLNNQDNFESAISGYFFFNTNYYKDIFILFYKNKIFKRALNTDLEKEVPDVKKHIVYNICLGFSTKLININDKHINIILLNKDLFNYLHFFFWNKNLHDSNMTIQILSLWRKIYNYNKINKDINIQKYFLGKTALWVENVDEINDEVFFWLKDSIIYVSDKDRYYLIKGLNKHINKSPEKIANLLILIFKNKVYYDISRGIIQDMVNIIYKKGFKILADKICLLHSEKGIHFLRNIYKKYNHQNI